MVLGTQCDIHQRSDIKRKTDSPSTRSRMSCAGPRPAPRGGRRQSLVRGREGSQPWLCGSRGPISDRRGRQRRADCDSHHTGRLVSETAICAASLIYTLREELQRQAQRNCDRKAACESCSHDCRLLPASGHWLVNKDIPSVPGPSPDCCHRPRLGNPRLPGDAENGGKGRT